MQSNETASRLEGTWCRGLQQTAQKGLALGMGDPLVVPGIPALILTEPPIGPSYVKRTSTETTPASAL
jgi:hypothetical protein